jgi:protein TonB
MANRESSPGVSPSVAGATAPATEPVLLELDAAPPAAAGIAVAASFLAHLVVAGTLAVTATTIMPRAQIPIKVRITKVEKPKPPPVVEEKKEEPKPPPPPEAKKKKKVETKKTTERKQQTPVPQAAPVQGLAPTALVPGGHGIAAPVGNTLMVEDDGKRRKAEDVQPMAAEDLTADAKLIMSSVTTPKYTDDAVDANLEGSFTVDVYVSDSGNVTQAELRKKVGYGMDARLLDAAKQARFTPRKNKLGRPEAGWSEIKFRLQIPG